MADPAAPVASPTSQHIQDLIKQSQTLAAACQDVLSNEATRTRLLSLSQQLTAALTKPHEGVEGITKGAGRHMCVQVASDLRVFEIIANEAKTATKLSSLTGAEEKLTSRIMRMMVALGFAAVDASGKYSATALTRRMTLPSVKAGVSVTLENAVEIHVHTPQYLKDSGYRLPRTMTDTPFQYARKTQLDNHNYYAQMRLETMVRFQQYTDGLYGGPRLAPWWQWFPIRQLLSGSRDPDVSFVDVGGGNGHQTAGLLRSYPEIKGRLIVQDLPKVIAGIKDLDPRVERMPWSFLNPQPKELNGKLTICGPKAPILHDLPDAVCQNILHNIRSVMIPGSARLLISDMIVPEIDAPLRQVDSDISMLIYSGGAERTAGEWSELLEGAGFKATKFWYPPGNQSGIIEVERV